ncbi:MAG: OST-HTH/LOTUS domain-containing protein, partial [Cyanobacteria bacterium J06649_4]
MPSLFSAFARFLQRLFRLGTQPEKALASRNSARNEVATYPREIVKRRSRTPVKVAAPTKKSPLNEESAPAQVPISLRRVLTLATCAMPKPRMHAGQFGSLLRQQDADFSYQKYGFTKLIYLLEAVPELVELERVNHPGAAPAYYVRDASRLNQMITEAVEAYPSEDGWVHIETVREAAVRSLRGGALPSRQSDEFFLLTYGFTTFKDLLESLPTLVEFKQDNSDYLRLLSSFNLRKQTAKPVLQPQKDSQKSSYKNSTVTTGSLTRRPSLATSSGVNSRQISQLSQFVGLSPEKLNQTVSELAAIALPERWYFGPNPPENFPYPILKSYLRYTFIRLQHEQKLFSASSGQPYKAFNTGLLDRLLRPIYALLT